MSFAKISLAGLGLLLILLIAGYISGNQPQRDSVAYVQDTLAIQLESQMINVGEVKLHVVTAGPKDGEPVILLHGFPEFWYAWRKPMATLAKAGYRVIVPDQRGYNLSDKPGNDSDYRVDKLAGDISGLITALGYQRVNLAAHDWGGGVGWWTVLLHPQQVKRFFVIDTPHPLAGEGFQTSEETNTWYRDFIKLPLIPAYLARLNNWKVLTDTFVNGSSAGSFNNEDLDQFRSAWANDNAIDTMAAWYRGNNEDPEQPATMQVSLPTMVIISPNDAYIPSDLTARSMAFLDNGELVTLAKGSHWIIQEQPEMIAKRLMNFLSGQIIVTN